MAFVSCGKFNEYQQAQDEKIKNLEACCKANTEKNQEKDRAIEALNEKMSGLGNYTAGDNISITSEKVINALIPPHPATTELKGMFGESLGYIHNTVNGG